MASVGDGPDISGGGPFQANTRIVAIIALTVAGVFVILGLGLSLLRALQQRAVERVSWAFSFVQHHVCLTLTANVSEFFRFRADFNCDLYQQRLSA